MTPIIGIGTQVALGDGVATVVGLRGQVVVSNNGDRKIIPMVRLEDESGQSTEYPGSMFITNE